MLFIITGIFKAWVIYISILTVSSNDLYQFSKKLINDTLLVKKK